MIGMLRPIIGLAAVCSAVLGSSAMVTMADETVVVSTLEWPPYTGSALPQGGVTTAAVEAAFLKMDKDIRVVYRPWKRAIDVAKKGTDDVIAYFPGYHCQHREGFVASEPIGSGPLGFAEHIDKPMEWETLDDISDQQLKIGTVLGYANTDKFDKMIGTGWIIAVPAPDDITNLKKLLRKRIDAVVIDGLVLEYLKATHRDIADGADMLRFDERPLEDKTLYLCFRDDEKGRSLKRIFNAGLEQIDIDGIVDNYFATHFRISTTTPARTRE